MDCSRGSSQYRYDVSLVQNVQTSSLAHPAWYSMANRVFSPEVTQPGKEVNHLPPTTAEVNNECSYTCTHPLSNHSVDMENFAFLHSLLEMFCQTCCLHMSMKPAASSVISVPIYQITLHHSPESGDHSIHCCDNSNLILHTAINAKLTQILGQFLQTLLFVQTGNAEQTATWNSTVQHLQSQTDDNTSNSTLQFCYLSLTHWLSH